MSPNNRDEPCSESDIASDDADIDAGKAQTLEETLRLFTATGKEGLEAGVGAASAFGKLLVADIALAGHAFGRAVLWFCIGIVCSVCAGLLLVGVLVAGLQTLFDLSLLASVAIVCAFVFVLAGFALWRGLYYLKYTRLNATRRQFSRWGIAEQTKAGAEQEGQG